ncbi:DUF5683 domain-containing protein [uncultured Bacteroides sp.]|mgnify:CR=1 FL=1|uniref:DUF5683 domain-containing protein n=1 Tax=uncultured Bacteroides sp. TaxID=162156 RepID=UPI0025F25EE7|nr:DUF5683 domain-containing protein [uncultured Bacteroides sp.]
MKKPFFRIALAGSLLFVCCLLGASDALAQKVLRRSDKMRPVWLANKTPKTTYLTFHYQVVEADGKTLDESRHECLVALSRYIGQTWKISGEAETDIRTENRNGQITESSVYSFHYKVKDEEVSVTSVKYDEYWEYVDYPGGGRYRCYVLFGVADAPVPQFDRLSFTRQYGVRGMMRSLVVPGWGQMYKGSTTKGLCILGGEVLLTGGIIVSENLRSSYVKKMHEQPKHQQTYNTKADNWENVRNVCIGAAAALYVYNLVDAAVANGRKRAKVHKPVQFAMYPTLGECNGVGFALNF